MTDAMVEMLRKQRVAHQEIHDEQCQRFYRVGELAMRHVFLAAAGEIPAEIQTAVQETLLPDQPAIVVNNG